MEKRGVESLIRALGDHQVRYLIVGGLAVVAHGYVRFTADVDLVLALDDANLRSALTALQSLQYRPRAPVAIDEFLDSETRQRWVREKNMTVFSLFSPLYPATEVDLFVQPPFDFPTAYARAMRAELAAGLWATFCSLDDLIGLKSKTGRPQDLDDIRRLKDVKKED